MTTETDFITIAQLKEIAKDTELEITAKRLILIGGYMVKIKVGQQEKTLATYQNKQPRHFKKADALLQEMTDAGLTKISFELASGYIEE